jgi:hypothetical protein
MSSENWHEERDRLIQLLKGVDSGKITHIDQADLGELHATNPMNVAALRSRLAKLNERLSGDEPIHEALSRSKAPMRVPEPRISR